MTVNGILDITGKHLLSAGGACGFGVAIADGVLRIGVIDISFPRSRESAVNTQQVFRVHPGNRGTR